MGLSRSLRSVTIEIKDDNLGPILVNVRLEVEGKTHSIDQPTVIYDGVGYNAKRFVWQGQLPMSRVLPNILYVDCMNYTDLDITKVAVSGAKKR